MYACVFPDVCMYPRSEGDMQVNQLDRAQHQALIASSRGGPRQEPPRPFALACRHPSRQRWRGQGQWRWQR